MLEPQATRISLHAVLGVAQWKRTAGLVQREPPSIYRWGGLSYLYLAQVNSLHLIPAPGHYLTHVHQKALHVQHNSALNV